MSSSVLPTFCKPYRSDSNLSQVDLERGPTINILDFDVREQSTSSPRPILPTPQTPRLVAVLPSIEAMETLSAVAGPLQGTVVGFLPDHRTTAWDRAADKVSAAVGTSWAFGIASASVVVWLAIGAPMQWGDTWQLIMNTAASIIAYLMVFMLQTTQNRDTRMSNRNLAAIMAEIKALRAEVSQLREGRGIAQAIAP